MKDPDNPDKRNNINWMRDEVTRNLVQYHRIKKVLYSGETDFQSIQIVDSYNYGICLVLDGKIQSGEKDEFVYHEALVQPVMLSHSGPKSVFIAGGGEGATLREVLNNRSVKRAVMVDLDEQVVDLCRRFLSTFHQSSFNDPRATIHFADARGYLEHTREKYDIAIIDIVDPLEAGPACLLYTKEYYQIIKDHLNPGGAMVIQSGSCGWTNLHIFTSIVSTLKSVYKIVQPYCVYVPSFVDLWGFTIASDSLNTAKLSADAVNKLISARHYKKMKSYDGLSHQAMFVLPKSLRRKLAASRRIITDEAPVFM